MKTEKARYKNGKGMTSRQIFDAYKNELYIKITPTDGSPLSRTDDKALRICRMSELITDDTVETDNHSYNVFYWLYIRGNYKSKDVVIVPTGDNWRFIFWDKPHLQTHNTPAEITDKGIESFAKIHTDLIKVLSISYKMNDVLYRRLSFVNPQNMLIKKDKQLYDKYSDIQIKTERVLNKANIGIWTELKKKLKDFSLRRFF